MNIFSCICNNGSRLGKCEINLTVKHSDNTIKSVIEKFET